MISLFLALPRWGVHTVKNMEIDDVWITWVRSCICVLSVCERQRESSVHACVNHCKLEWMCLLVRVSLHHWVSIHIRCCGRIKWHCWRYVVARSGYIFICHWQLEICSSARPVCVRTYACMLTESRVMGSEESSTQADPSVCISHVAIEQRVCVCVWWCVGAPKCVWERQRGQMEWWMVNVSRKLISIDNRGRITGWIVDAEWIDKMQTR